MYRYTFFKYIDLSKKVSRCVLIHHLYTEHADPDFWKLNPFTTYKQITNLKILMFSKNSNNMK